MVDHTSLADDALIARGALMGSPSVSNERMCGAEMMLMASDALAKYVGVKEFAATIWCVCFACPYTTLIYIRMQ